jgi:hypothetical protein
MVLGCFDSYKFDYIDPGSLGIIAAHHRRFDLDFLRHKRSEHSKNLGRAPSLNLLHRSDNLRLRMPALAHRPSPFRLKSHSKTDGAIPLGHLPLVQNRYD